MWRRLWNLIRSLFRFLLGEPKPDQKSPPLEQPVIQPELAVPPSGVAPEYLITKSLLTYQEKRFYEYILLPRFAREYAIFMKVRLGDVVYLANKLTQPKEVNNQIQCKHIDFVLCNKSSLKPVIGIELDDSSHVYTDSKLRDKVKDDVCATAGLPLHRETVRGKYDINLIEQEIRRKIELSILETEGSTNYIIDEASNGRIDT